VAYENIANWTLGENKPNSKPIKANSKPIKANSKPIKANKMPKQTQYKPNQTQLQTRSEFIPKGAEIPTGGQGYRAFFCSRKTSRITAAATASRRFFFLPLVNWAGANLSSAPKLVNRSSWKWMGM